jgi:diguanylate cyclase (GGDEF)-like protein
MSTIMGEFETMTTMHAPAAPALDAPLLAEVLRHALDGVAVIEGDQGGTHVTYGNATLAALLRRPEDWLAGRVLEDIEVEAPADPNLTNSGVGVRVRLKRTDGSTVDCERWAVMLPGARVALYYRPLARSAPGALAAALERSSGLSTEEHLLELLARDWSVGQRDSRNVTLMRFEIDTWSDYCEVFGRGASDNVLRQIGRTIATVTKRTSDVVAKCGGGEFMVLGLTMEPDAAFGFARQIVDRIRSLSIHHPRSATGRFLTVSAGVVTVTPPRERPASALVRATRDALSRARSAGGNHAMRGELGDADE